MKRLLPIFVLFGIMVWTSVVVAQPFPGPSTGLLDTNGRPYGVDNTAGAIHVVQTSATAGTALDSADAGQDASWIDVTDGSSADANLGAIPVASILAGTVVKLYAIPAAKEFHEIAITGTDTDANDFEYNVQIFTLNDIPTAAWALTDWMSVSALAVASFKVSRDRSETVIAQPLVRSHAEYFLVVIDTVTLAPASNPRVRIYSYNAGDSR